MNFKIIYNDLFVPLNTQIYLIIIILNFSLITLRNRKLLTWTKPTKDVNSM